MRNISEIQNQVGQTEPISNSQLQTQTSTSHQNTLEVHVRCVSTALFPQTSRNCFHRQAEIGHELYQVLSSTKDLGKSVSFFPQTALDSRKYEHSNLDCKNVPISNPSVLLETGEKHLNLKFFMYHGQQDHLESHHNSLFSVCGLLAVVIRIR